MRFEKWQALGNDYLIFEEVELTSQQVRKLCDPHFGPGAEEDEDGGCVAGTESSGADSGFGIGGMVMETSSSTLKLPKRLETRSSTRHGSPRASCPSAGRS